MIFVSNKNSVVPVVISDFVNIRCDVIHINFYVIKVRVGFLKKKERDTEFQGLFLPSKPVYVSEQILNRILLEIRNLPSLNNFKTAFHGEDYNEFT